ncbi:hypothetical protein LSH36_22g04044 [Paralvinella palmiformis]|uniref:MD-2-related lipid-recognition domain-containing protein n=1 Tax=Paralvinella palmiformis TaxID=53620 RepID=A0AAD9NFB1_9ANNE|nr:hypothetical protein LSH36_22g04044 [Paralvinella palmiformis]
MSANLSECMVIYMHTASLTVVKQKDLTSGEVYLTAVQDLSDMDRQQLYSLTVLYLIFALATTCVGKFAPADLKNKIYIGKQRDDINKLINSSPKADLGYAVPCEKGDPPFRMTWSPKNITIERSANCSFSFTLPVDVKNIYIEMGVWMLEYQNPLLELRKYYSCDELASYTNVSCPLKNGETISVLNYPLKAISSKLITGEFTVQLKVFNEKNQVVLCARGSINVKVADTDSSYLNYYDQY